MKGDEARRILLLLLSFFLSVIVVDVVVVKMTQRTIIDKHFGLLIRSTPARFGCVSTLPRHCRHINMHWYTAFKLYTCAMKWMCGLLSRLFEWFDFLVCSPKSLEQAWMNHLLITSFDWISIRFLSFYSILLSELLFISIFMLDLHAFITGWKIKSTKMLANFELYPTANIVAWCMKWGQLNSSTNNNNVVGIRLIIHIYWRAFACIKNSETDLLMTSNMPIMCWINEKKKVRSCAAMHAH